MNQKGNETTIIHETFEWSYSTCVQLTNLEFFKSDVAVKCTLICSAFSETLLSVFFRIGQPGEIILQQVHIYI